MTSERIQRRIDALLDEAEEAAGAGAWDQLRELAGRVLTLDPTNVDAVALLAAAERGIASSTLASPNAASAPAIEASPAASASQPTSFANGRYTVKRFLGEGGKKKVYLAHDRLLDRDVAFALIKTEGLDEASRTRITREAQAMGRLGDHPNIVTVYDIGEEAGAPYMVLPVLAGGDVEGVIEKAPEQRMPLEQALKIAIETCRGLEFAHGRGIVHRDLKPGNVWLAEDGTAKIGDFGLAIATDRSRLTQAGMMVGTVSYMPPEQAMGGEVGPRSDLYSLGAMLYEMVCGRPPFVGDESVAIIGQHLNTPPVAPTWHRPDCPPALETLILRLLEKDPSKRPTSATEVREALEIVNNTSHSQARDPSIATETPGVGDNPLYRRTFVGRENEVRQLQAAFDAALSGQGGLVMVVGEPGIGKTAICEQLATYVALRGGKALVGHCYEEGSLSLPYLAFVEALRSYVLTREPDGLRSDLGTGAADVARIVSEVRDRVQGVELRPAGDLEDDRWRLLQAVTSFLRNASTVQPLVIVLEDLHWADRGTLDLLLHVSRNLPGARLLIVGTYRDVEVDRSHPLSGVLADLRRGANFARVPLRGLTVDEVHRMYAAIRGQDVSWAQAEAVHRQTEGNPLFIQEVIRYMVEEGFVVREAGRWVLAEGTQPGTGLPEGLRDVVGKRLSRLSAECNRLLSVAAVIGRDFDLLTLRGVAALDEEALLGAIEEAVRVGVLDERSMPGAVRYRFAHAFFRQSLYEEMIAPRRLRLHQEVARTLEAQYAFRREEHAAELADHYGQSTDRADLSKAVEYSDMAARRAMSVFAYAEAEGHLRKCLEVQEVLDPGDADRRCDLLLKLGEAMLPLERPMRVLEDSAEQAYGLADAKADAHRASKAALQALEAIDRAGAWRSGKVLTEWIERLTKYSRQDSREWAYVQFYTSYSLTTTGGLPAAWHPYVRSASDLVLKLSDNATFFRIAARAFGTLRALRDRELREKMLAEMFKRDQTGVPARNLGICLALAGRLFLERGERNMAEKCWSDLQELVDRSGDTTMSLMSLEPPIFLRFIDGRLEDVLALSEEMRLKRDELAVGTITAAGSDVILPMLTARTLMYLGRSPEPVLGLVWGYARGTNAVRSAILAYLGRDVESKEAAAIFGDVLSDEDETASAMLMSLFEGAIALGDEVTQEGLLRRLAPYSDSLAEVSVSIGVEVSVGRMCAKAASNLGRPAEAREYFIRGLAVCEKVRFRPEIALIRLDLAELLLEHYPDERDAAIEHLDFSIAELRDMKMQPALERALRHRGLLKA